MPFPHSAELRSVGSPVPTQSISESLGAIATAPIDCTGCLSKTESKVTPLSPVLNKPPVESPTKNTAGLRGSIARSETRPPIAAGPIDLALKFLNKISFSNGGADSAGDAPATAGAPGEAANTEEVSGEAPGDDDATASGAPGVDGRVPAKVADGACARAMAEQVRLTVMKTTAFIKLTSSSKPARCRLASA